MSWHDDQDFDHAVGFCKPQILASLLYQGKRPSNPTSLLLHIGTPEPEKINQFIEVVGLLSEHGILAPSDLSENVFRAAQLSQSGRLMKFAVELGGNSDQALRYAARFNYLNLAAWLLKRAVNVGGSMPNLEAAMNLAIARSSEDFVRLLEQYGGIRPIRGRGFESWEMMSDETRSSLLDEYGPGANHNYGDYASTKYDKD